MDKAEFEKLQRAGQMIKAGQYDKVRALLKTMPNSEKAREWLIRIKEKEAFEQTPTTPQKSASSAPNTLKPKTKSSLTKKVLMLIGGVVFIAVVAMVGIQVLINDASYNSYLPRATTVLGAFCAITWEDRSASECLEYANRYLEQDRSFLYQIQICETWWNDGDLSMFTYCLRDVKVPVEILGY